MFQTISDTIKAKWFVERKAEVCDKLPDTYNPDIFKTKCDNLYVHLYDNYLNNQHRVGNE